MSREILFRGKRVDNGEWVEGLPYKAKYGGISSIVDKDEERHLIIPETLCEFTGLYNRAERKIFERDIVRFEDKLYRVRREDETPGGYWASTAFILQHIGWNDYMSFVDTIDDFCNEICVEILGNIHDNPELMEVQDEQNV